MHRLHRIGWGDGKSRAKPVARMRRYCFIHYKISRNIDAYGGAQQRQATDLLFAGICSANLLASLAQTLDAV